MLLCLVAAEATMRWVDDVSLFKITLPPRNIGRDTTLDHLDDIPRAAGVRRDWFFTEPPPLPNRRPVPAGWLAVTPQQREADVVPDNRFKSWDSYKAWNAALVDDLCFKGFFGDAPRPVFLFDPPAGEKQPPFRYLPDSTTPMGLVTNEFGWRGPPVRFPRADRTLRIVFVGASTVAGAHQFPYAVPELLEHWLNLWAADRGLGIRIEVLNAAREGLNSAHLESVVRQEVVPARPDLVVYSEGGNQFNLDELFPDMPRPRPAAPPAPADSGWLKAAAQHSALARRLQSLAGLYGFSAGSYEAPKPGYPLRWPAGLDEADPDLGHPALPVDLGTILGDLDRIRGDLAAVDAELAVASFIWMARDGLVVDPIRSKLLWESLNVRYWPYRYRDIERLAGFQNRVFAKYAASRGLPFLDVAGGMPLDPDLFADALHETFPGMRLKAWVAFQQLVPLIEKRLASGAWPRPAPTMPDAHPAFAEKPRQVTVDCREKIGASAVR